MTIRKALRSEVEAGYITGVSSEMSIAGGNIYKEFTSEHVSVLLTQITSIFRFAGLGIAVKKTAEEANE